MFSKLLLNGVNIIKLYETYYRRAVIILKDIVKYYRKAWIILKYILKHYGLRV